MKFLYGVIVLTLTMTSFRLGDIALFDLLMVLFLFLFLFLYKKDSLNLIMDLKFLLILFFLYCVAFTLSYTQAGDPNTHFSRGIPFILVIVLTWMFGFSSVYTFKNKLNYLMNFILLGLTLGSISVIVEGIFFKEVLGDIDVSRQVGWMEHPIEAGYIASYGVSLSIWMLYKSKSKIYILPLFLNLFSLKFSASMTAIFALLIASFLLLFIWKKSFKALLFLPIFSFIVIFYTDIKESFIYDRIVNVFSQGSNYETVDSRLSQNNLILDLIDESTIFFGNGYSVIETVKAGGLEVHNGLLASLYHFGFLGFFAQLISLSIIFLSFLKKLMMLIISIY